MAVVCTLRKYSREGHDLMEGQWWWQLNPSGGGDGRDEWREVLTLLGIPYCVHFCEFMRHCVLPGKSHLWACWSEELLKLALAGYRATGLAGCTPAFTSDVNHSFASLPCAIQKYFVTLLVGSFLKCYFKSQKREPWKCRLSIPVRLDAPYSCEIQSTIVVTGARC